VVTPEQIREIALGLPATDEHPDSELAAFRVSGETFATLHVEDGTLDLAVTLDHIDTLVGVNPLAYSAVEDAERNLRVRLAGAALGEVDDLIVDAWFECAPNEVAMAYRDELLG
jgi:hypothetical protein